MEPKESQTFQRMREIYWELINDEITFDTWLFEMKGNEQRMDREFPGWGGWKFSDLQS